MMYDSFGPAGRLAIREIRDEVRFYYALPDTMKGAILLGSIQANLVRGSAERLHALIQVYRDAVAEIIYARTGEKVEWPTGPQSAPEHERGKEPYRDDA
jgi:hypothetical protein